MLYISGKQNRRPGEEHGSARWGNPRQLDRKYRDKDPHRNAILTQNLRMSLNSRQHFRNLLQIVVGGSGAGKTRYIVKPNIYEANASYIATDPKGELARDSIPLLLREGYTIKVFDLVDPDRSDCYNPFHYIRNDADVLKLIANFIRNTTPKNAHSNDPFWEKSETALDSALMLYLLHEAPPEDQTMEMMLTMLEYGAAKEGDGDHVSALDLLFQALEEENPNHIAVRQYKVFKQATSETAMSILISAAVRLAPFSLPEIQRVTSRDEMELGKLGERKQAIFCIIPDSNDVSLNFLVGMLYSQAFQELYFQADKVHGGSLSIPVRLMFDEFANVSLPDGYARLQATMRSRNVMATIIVCGYEAGCLGCSLYHQLYAHGVGRMILAPTMMMATSGKRIKTDRRDARLISKCLAFHTYSPVYIPTEMADAVKEYIRMRDDANSALVRVKQQIIALCIRHGKIHDDRR